MSNASSDTLSEAYAKAIGTLVVNVSKLERVITELIATLLRIDYLGAMIVVQHQQFSNKVDCLLALMKPEFDVLDFKAFHDDIRAAKKLGEFRNTVVHASWVIEKDGTAVAVRFQARGKLTLSRQLIPASEIQRRADEALALTLRLKQIEDYIFGSENAVSHS